MKKQIKRWKEIYQMICMEYTIKLVTGKGVNKIDILLSRYENGERTEDLYKEFQKLI